MKPAPSANKQPFLSDVKTLRDRARQHIEEGAVTAGYGGDTAVAVKVLNEEQEHADRIAERIIQLGGEPNFSPDGLLSRSHSEYVEGKDLVDMIKEDLIAERIAIDSYREIAAYFAPFDGTTRRMIEEIQAVEEEHADDLAELLKDFPARG
ncbi:MAG: bacterioferritin [Betaproteobacteria bacterium]|nr:MAG: bacterioferritin [Betaproteobacteria bacterium]